MSMTKKSLLERMIEKHAPIVEDITLETGEHEALDFETTDNTKQHKEGCTYQRYPFVCNCQ